MKLFNKKFIEFSFEPNLVTNLDKGFITIKYFKSWTNIFTANLTQIRFELFPKLGKEFVLKFFDNEIIIKNDDRICVQIFYYKNDLHIVINRPINAETLDSDKHVETFADIFGKANFKFFKWWNIKTYCDTIRINRI